VNDKKSAATIGLVSFFYAKSDSNKEQKSHMYAMGYDTYRLIPLLNGEVHKLVAPVAGMTGQLYMDDSGRVHRKLSWARIERGRPQPLPDLPTPLAGDIDTAMTGN
jgi:hypothetical protein